MLLLHPPGPGVCSLRFGLCLLVHFCNMTMMSQHVCLSLTMVAMVNVTEPRGPPNTSAEGLPDAAKVRLPCRPWSHV